MFSSKEPLQSGDPIDMTKRGYKIMPQRKLQALEKIWKEAKLNPIKAKDQLRRQKVFKPSQTGDEVISEIQLLVHEFLTGVEYLDFLQNSFITNLIPASPSYSISD